jgi:uncharacterized protein YndB with AHSA1/START domain
MGGARGSADAHAVPEARAQPKGYPELPGAPFAPLNDKKRQAATRTERDTPLMLKFEKSITIEAPVAEVFAYATKPEHLPEYWNGMVEIKDVKRLPTGGFSFAYKYKLAGLRFEGTAEYSEFVANAHVITKVRGDLDGTMDWKFERRDGQTHLICVQEFNVPGKVFGKLAEPLIAKVFEHDAELTLMALKARVEMGLPAATR